MLPLSISDSLDTCLRLVSGAINTGHNLMSCGNGGSASNASHFVADLFRVISKGSKSSIVLCLSDSQSILTQIANDYGFDQTFSRQVMAFGSPQDVLLSFSVSGTSENIYRVNKQANALGMKTIVFTSRSAHLDYHADLIIRSQFDDPALVESEHSFFFHHISQKL